MAKKVLVVLSGCGVFDGSEIYETTLTLLHLSKAGANVVCAAPNIPQAHVVNHLTGQVEEGATRNVLVESARLTRGHVVDLATVDPTGFDAVIFPGGFGAAKNLSNFAFTEKMAEVQISPVVAGVVRAAYAAGVVLGFICIAPVSVAAVALEGKGLTLTIGEDAPTAAKLTALGHRHQTATVFDVVVDPAHKVVSTPAYMCGQTLAEVDSGLAKFVTTVLSLT